MADHNHRNTHRADARLPKCSLPVPSLLQAPSFSAAASTSRSTRTRRPLSSSISISPAFQYRVERDRAVIAIASGALEAKRRWPASRFAELAGKLQARFKAIVLLVGDQHDAELAGEISETPRGNVVDLVEQTTLRQTAALLRRYTMFIGNCSGPLHLASAAGVAVVEISCHPQTVANPTTIHRLDWPMAGTASRFAAGARDISMLPSV
jgi:phage FluMu protein gp41